MNPDRVPSILVQAAWAFPFVVLAALVLRGCGVDLDDVGPGRRGERAPPPATPARGHRRQRLGAGLIGQSLHTGAAGEPAAAFLHPHGQSFSHFISIRPSGR